MNQREVRQMIKEYDAEGLAYWSPAQLDEMKVDYRTTERLLKEGVWEYFGDDDLYIAPKTVKRFEEDHLKACEKQEFEEDHLKACEKQEFEEDHLKACEILNRRGEVTLKKWDGETKIFDRLTGYEVFEKEFYGCTLKIEDETTFNVIDIDTDFMVAMIEIKEVEEIEDVKGTEVNNIQTCVFCGKEIRKDPIGWVSSDKIFGQYCDNIVDSEGNVIQYGSYHKPGQIIK